MKKRGIQPKSEEIEKFSTKIISLVEKDKLDYIDAITEYCEEIGLEVEVAVTLITPFILSKVSEEARRYNLIEKSPMLPI